ncbi:MULTISPECIES: hypothetical protein [Pelosinus]|uniref:Uncharacterized protein n=1 Tax=Pelosinus fermentans B4 TaxID=1149862 RepID=I9B6E1_9FIRM|nr:MULTISPECIES: hypothetical protein [Pelosinus]EIW20717.1 hypothetical protein FB4_1929 [Pelosinus fermentans B4]EIW25438.1 hypothetical protein FA11_2597 [Pelosinus fermentans A11]OAM93698.1 hypothetical protein FR7_01715 [Pelosinus fermentans DSM 17108]SDQ86971.1 hypothetical protein SAMN04515679_1801 [Pelosinus fermentans]
MSATGFIRRRRELERLAKEQEQVKEPQQLQEEQQEEQEQEKQLQEEQQEAVTNDTGTGTVEDEKTVQTSKRGTK